MPSFKGIYLIPLLSITIIASALLGYYVGFQGYLQKPNSQKGISSEDKFITSPLFQSQSATVQGTIIKVSGNKITVQDDKKQTGEFITSPRLVIYRPPKDNKPATPSSDLKTLELNKKALIIFEFANGEYQAASISYLNQ